jgi:hypothetical protein
VGEILHPDREANMGKKPTLLVCGLSVLLLFVGCSQQDSKEGRNAPPAGEQADPVPSPNPWPASEAACILYNATRKTFTLMNVSPHPIWYDDRSEVYECQLPTGRWAATFVDDCGTGRKWDSLAPGAQYTLSPLPVGTIHPARTTDRELAEFSENPGGLDHLPVRVRITITCNPRSVGFRAKITSPEIARPLRRG